MNAAKMYAGYSRLIDHARIREEQAVRRGDTLDQALAINDRVVALENRDALAPLILDEMDRILLDLPIIVPATDTVASL